MNTLADQVRANAQTVDRLWKRIDETLEHRGRSKADKDAWIKACANFHQAFPDLVFPGGSKRWEAFLSGDSAEIETAVVFLEIDPIFFRSGYLKQIIWDRLKRCALTSQQERRLEQVAAAYLQRRVEREFWHMARYVRFRGSPTFWESMEALTSRHAASASMKAHWLLLAKENIPVRRLIGSEVMRARQESGYIPNLWFVQE